MNKLIIVFLLSFALLPFPSPSEGSDWRLVETLTAQGTIPKSRSYYYIDMDSIKKSGEKVRYWDKLLSVPPGDPEPADNQVAKGSGWMRYHELDCSRRRYRDVTSEKEEGSGYVQVYPGIEWDNIKPDSLEEKIEKIVCKRRK